MFGSLAGGRTSDFLRKRAVSKYGSEKIPPEGRISTQIYGYILSATGLLMYGWFCRYHIHVSAALVASAVGKHKPRIRPTSSGSRCRLPDPDPYGE